MNYFRTALMLALTLTLTMGLFALSAVVIPAAHAAPNAKPAMQATAVAAPTPTPRTLARDRIQAPPLRPQAAGLLIGANLLLALAIVIWARFLRRRNQQQR